MSAAPASLRPEATVTPLPVDRPLPLPDTPARLEARARSTERLRLTFTAAYFAAMALPPAAVLAGPANGDDWPVAVMILCYGLVTPAAGLVSFAFAVSRRRWRETRALLAAVLTLPASIALLPYAGAAGQEMALDRRAGKMQALAAEIGRMESKMVGVVNGVTDTWAPGEEPPAELVAAAEQVRDRVRAAGFDGVSADAGSVAFYMDLPFTPDLLYRGGGATPEFMRECSTAKLRYAGGSWYLYQCDRE